MTLAVTCHNHAKSLCGERLVVLVMGALDRRLLRRSSRERETQHIRGSRAHPITSGTSGARGPLHPVQQSTVYRSL